jgi:hypothetical protein
LVSSWKLKPTLRKLTECDHVAYSPFVFGAALVVAEVLAFWLVSTPLPTDFWAFSSLMALLLCPIGALKRSKTFSSRLLTDMIPTSPCGTNRLKRGGGGLNDELGQS